MNTSPIRHILFDLGGTLMHASKDWIPVLELGDQALGEKLLKHGITIDPKIFRARLHKYYEQRDKDFRETTYHFVLGELLKELGYAEVPESVIRSALDALYSVTQTNWKLEEDALETLQKLKSLNCKLGIFSNAGDDKDVQELIETFGIRSYFDFVLTSATLRGSFQKLINHSYYTKKRLKGKSHQPYLQFVTDLSPFQHSLAPCVSSSW